jgi:hypothetical protein
VLPVNPLLLPDPLEEHMQQLFPDPAALPVPQATPTGDARTAAHLQREHLPGDAAAQDENDTREAGPVIDRRSASLAGSRLVPRQQGGNRFPEFVGDQWLSHGDTSGLRAPSTTILRSLLLK